MENTPQWGPPPSPAAYPQAPPVAAPRVYDTKVLELREGRFRGGFTTGRLEQLLIEEGRQGWEIKGVIDVDKIHGGGKNRGGLLVLLQRAL